MFFRLHIFLIFQYTSCNQSNFVVEIKRMNRGAGGLFISFSFSKSLLQDGAFFHQNQPPFSGLFIWIDSILPVILYKLSPLDYFRNSIVIIVIWQHRNLTALWYDKQRVTEWNLKNFPTENHWKIRNKFYLSFWKDRSTEFNFHFMAWLNYPFKL